MTNRCQRPTCRKRFTYTPLILDGVEVPELFCQSCRSVILGRQWYAVNNTAIAEVEAYSRMISDRLSYDYRIIDENGVEVWGLDLASKYHRQTRPDSF